MAKEVKLKPKKVKGRITILKATLYKSHMIYIRMINGEIFEFIVEFGGQVYSSYLIITPTKGKKKLTEDEINQSAALIFAGAVATLDMLLGEEVTKEQKAMVEEFEKVGEEIYGEKEDA